MLFTGTSSAIITVILTDPTSMRLLSIKVTLVKFKQASVAHPWIEKDLLYTKHSDLIIIVAVAVAVSSLAGGDRFFRKKATVCNRFQAFKPIASFMGVHRWP